MAIEWLLPVAKDLYEYRNEVFSTWDAFVSKVFGPKSSIAFVGPGGVGKTILLDHIVGNTKKSGYVKPPQSRRSETGKAKASGNRLALLVAPGQGGPKMDSFSEIFSEENAVDGVVFVAGNGLINLRSEEAKSVQIKQGRDSIEKWREVNLREELNYLRDVVVNIRSSNKKSRKPSWMLVCVTKADLLFSEIRDVEMYYSPHGDSEFTALMKDLVVATGQDNFEWDALPVCSVLEDFSWGEEVLSTQLDGAARDHYLAQMVDKLGELCR